MWVPPLAVAVFALALTVLRSRRHHHPALDLAALAVGPLWTSCVALLMFTAAFGAMLLGNVLFLTDVWHLPPPQIAGLGLAPGPAAAVLISLTVASRLIRRFGDRYRN